MIGVDTNVLLAAANRDDPQHGASKDFVTKALAHDSLVLPWTVLYEFLRIVTHRRVLPHPWDMASAWKFVAGLSAADNAHVVTEGPRHASSALRLLPEVRGNLVFDAHVAAVLLDHGVRDLCTYDRDFLRFEALRVVTPETY